MQSYIGLLAREHDKVNIDSWREVSTEVKELIWETVKSSYNIPERWKFGCLQLASVKWRTWKTRFYKDFILPNQDDKVKLSKPPDDTGILPTDWNEFVITRISDAFKRLSEGMKERRKKHIYPHHLSRKGYARFVEEIKNSESLGDEDVDRAMMWKKARLNKDGEIDNENVKMAMQKINDYIRENEEGKFESKGGSDDLLSHALEKPEHSGRVQAVGAVVNPSTYFKCTGESRRAMDEKSQHQLEHTTKRMEEQDERIHVLDKVVIELLGRIAKLEDRADVAEKDKTSEVKDNCSVKAPLREKPNDDVLLVEKSTFLQGKTVALLLESSKAIVGYGTVVLAGDFLHGAPMPNDCFRVLIDEVVDENASLPYHISDEM